MADQGCVPGDTQYRVVAGGRNVTVEYCLTRGDSIGLAVSSFPSHSVSETDLLCAAVDCRVRPRFVRGDRRALLAHYCESCLPISKLFI